MIDVHKLAESGRPSLIPRYVPPAPPTRRGQREVVAATLAAGLIAADHTRPATVENAVALMRAVHAEMWPQVENETEKQV